MENTTALTKASTREITADHARELGLPSPEAINYMSNISKLIINSALITGDMICGTCQGKGQSYDRDRRQYVQCRECEGEFNEAKVQANAMAKMLVGHEMEIPAIQALQEVDIVKGRIFVRYPQLLSQMMRKGFKLDWVERSNSRAALKVTPPKDYPMEEETFEFTMSDAAAAGLSDSDQYKKRPRIMLASRVISEAYRATGGQSRVYTPEEKDEILRGDAQPDPETPEGRRKNRYMEGLESSAAKAETAPAGAETGPAPAHQDNHTQKQQSGSQAGVKDEAAAEPEAPKAGGKRTSATPSSSPAPAPEQSDDPNHADNKNSFQAMLAAFKLQRDRIGDKLYYEILGAAGYEHANQFPSMSRAREVYRLMKDVMLEPPRNVADDSDLPENMQPKPETKEEPKKKVNPLAEEIGAEVSKIMQAFPRNKDGQLKKSDAAIKLCIGGFFKGVYGKGGLPAPDDANIHALRVCIGLLAKNVEMYPDSVAESPAKAEAAGKVVGEGMRACANFIAARSFDAKMAFWNMAIPRYADSGGRDAIEWFNGMGGAEGTKFVQELEDKDFMLLMTLAGRKVGGLWDLAEHAGKRGVKISDIQTRSGFDFSTAPVAGIEAFIHGLKNQPESDAAEPEAEPEAAEEAAKGGDEWSWV